jgi:hypothetical protein
MSPLVPRTRPGNRQHRHLKVVRRECFRGQIETTCFRRLRSTVHATAGFSTGVTHAQCTPVATGLSVTRSDRVSTAACAVPSSGGGRSSSQGTALRGSVTLPLPAVAPGRDLPAQRLAQGRQFAPITMGVTVVDEEVVPVVRGRDGAGMLDWAPILLGASRDVLDERERAVGVSAEDAVYFFDPIQIGELVPIDDEVRTTRHPRDAVDRKAYPLIDEHPEIQQGERNDHGIDDRRRNQAQDIARTDLCRDALPDTSMRLMKLRVEPQTPALHPVAPSPLLCVRLPSAILLDLAEAYGNPFRVS